MKVKLSSTKIYSGRDHFRIPHELYIKEIITGDSIEFPIFRAFGLTAEEAQANAEKLVALWNGKEPERQQYETIEGRTPIEVETVNEPICYQYDMIECNSEDADMTILNKYAADGWEHYDTVYVGGRSEITRYYLRQIISR